MISEDLIYFYNFLKLIVFTHVLQYVPINYKNKGEQMITRTEELILLSVWRLKDDAYSVKIREHLKDVTGQFWSFGAVYMPLDRMVKRGLLQSQLSEPTQKRGGRSKRKYQLTPFGFKALEEIKKIQETAWKGLPRPHKEKS